MSDISVQHTGEDLTVLLRGEIDHHSARLLREQIDAAIDKAVPKRLFLDMGGVGFMDSSGIGLIMGRYRRMQTLGGTLTLIHLSETLCRLIRLAGLDRLSLYEEKKG